MQFRDSSSGGLTAAVMRDPMTEHLNIEKEREEKQDEEASHVKKNDSDVDDENLSCCLL